MTAVTDPRPAPNPPQRVVAKTGDPKPVASGAERVYRAAQTIALTKARSAAQSEEEVGIIFPTVFAQVMAEYPVVELAALFARAEDPELLRLRLLNDIAVERYLRSKRANKAKKLKKPPLNE